jgi:hypothetical protein
VYRPEAEVFNKDTLHSFAWRPMTNDHPADPVTAENWKKFAVGQSGDEVVRDGDAIRVPLVLMDAATIKEVQDGKRQLSMGYTTDLKWESGKAPNGEDYDAIQTNIRANHLAIVAEGKAGPEYRIGDDVQRKEPNMSDAKPTVRMFKVDGIDLEMSDTAFQVVNKTIEKQASTITGLEKRLSDAATAAEAKKKEDEEAAAKAKKENEAKDGEIAALKKQVADAAVTPQKLDQLVKDRAAVIETGRKILGDKLVTDGKTDADIRKQVVTAQLGEVGVKDKSDEYITAAFDTLTKSVKDGKAPDALAQALSNPNTQAAHDAAEKAHTGYVKHLQDAWKGDTKAA